MKKSSVVAPEITILSTIPPIKGMSLYTTPFLEALDKKIPLSFLGFKALYPEFVYPGGTRDYSLRKPKTSQTSISNYIAWYNPFSWIKAGLNIKGSTVHAQWWSWILAPIYLVVLGIGRLRGKQIILTVHNVSPHEKSLLKNFMNNIVYKVSHKFIVHSKSNKESLAKVTSKEISIIPHGIIAPEFKKESKEKLRTKYKIQQKQKVILFYGNIRKYKGLDILLTAFSQIVKQDKNYTLLIAGPCWEDWSIYQSIINKEDISKHILRIDNFIGEQQTGELFTLSDALILPYKDFDSQSGVIATNLHFNLPVIVSDLPGLTEVIKDSDYIFTVKDHQDLQKKILDIFDKENIEKAKTYLKDIKKDFEWDSIVNKTLDFYKA